METVRAHWDEMERLVDRLIDEETLTREQIIEILSGKEDQVSEDSEKEASRSSPSVAATWSSEFGRVSSE
jgi:TPP-dependent pyruvate/acetoin dehydrogenase alpha subunit